MLLLFPAPGFSLGGPPMITDDPETVGNKKWEINIAQLTMASSSSWFIQNPYIDINYGLGDKLQLKYESGVAAVSNNAIPYGGSYANAGIRWKFYANEENGISASTYPQYSFFPPYYSKISSVNVSQTNFFLPFQFSKKLGKFSVTSEIGYNFVTGDENTWQLGILIGREISKTWAVMAELRTQIMVSSSQSIDIFNMGTTQDISETFSLIGSVGSSFATPSAFWISYLGLQIHL